MKQVKAYFAQNYGPLLVVALCLVLQWLLTGIYQDWWLEDDVYQREFILSCQNPIKYFFDSDSAYAFNMGRTFTPMLAFTLFIDSLLHPTAPVYAYIHTMVSLSLTAWLLFAVVARYTSAWTSAFLTGSWLFLPGTLVVTEFIAGRHYLEGLMVSLAAYLLALRYPYATKLKNIAAMVGIVALYYVASLYKETYLVFTAFMLGLVFLKKRQWHGIICVFFTGVTYTVHRLWFIKGVTTENFTIEAEHFFQFTALPFTVTGNQGGYVIFAVMLLLLVWYLIKRIVPISQTIWLLGGLAMLCLPLLPVFRHLYTIDLELCSWYRLVFLFATVVWLFGGWLLFLWPQRWLARLAGTLAVVMLLFGSFKTAENFDNNKAAYREEATFYLENPDKLLFSEIPAPWFIGNVQSLYSPHEKPHYIDYRGLLDRGVIQDLLEEHETIWRWTPTGYAPDPEFHRELIEKNKAMAPFVPGFRKITD